ncbi:MAG: hypothetical protein JJU13_20970 [Balneolaceae bacterium]|nr:hypothetical protein [Balneolaceae bacterium]
MAQPSVPLEPGQMYHIWTHANGNENLFRKEENYPYFLNKYACYVTPVADTFAYCLMPNHLHFMVRVKMEEVVLEFLRNRKSNPKPTLQGFQTLGGFSNVISRQFSNLFNSYTQAYNKVYKRKGSLFTPNFKRKLIDSDNYFGTLIAYIHNNPVHHGFVEAAHEWPHSSWNTYLQDKSTKVKKEVGLEWLGNREQFFRMHREIRMEKLTSLFEE